MPTPNKSKSEELKEEFYRLFVVEQSVNYESWIGSPSEVLEFIRSKRQEAFEDGRKYESLEALLSNKKSDDKADTWAGDEKEKLKQKYNLSNGDE